MSSRERILDGAAEVLRTQGLANATTKEIAGAAGLSEAMLYKLFDDKVDLFLAVLAERTPSISALSGTADAVADGGLKAELRRLTADVLSFYLESFPIAASVFSDPDLLVRHREAIHERGAGPHHVVESVTDYLAAQQRAGRLTSAARPEYVAELLVGACLHRAFLLCFAGRTPTAEETEQFAAHLVDELVPARPAPGSDADG